MGKKIKVGKQRRDKAYWSAKELGFRSRASFKLVQLNRKHEFLQKSRVCIDLCAAPGSWMQVAKEHMPLSSLIIGVDLVPIKPIPGCIAIQGDITTDKCRSDLKKELQTWKADLVLHDGAPNVGKNWLHDAYQQALLTLHSFKLATEFLVKGGTFVTKVFRSKDYQSLMWVFNQFFRNVHATKPAASRNESAEIFVVCLGYKAPDKIDPKFLDAKHVFAELDVEDAKSNTEILNPDKKKKAEGYPTGATLLYKKAKASEFIMGDKPIDTLNNYNEIVLDESRIRKHKATTAEIVECCKDIRILDRSALRSLKKWRDVLKTDFIEAEKKKKEREAQKAKEAEANGGQVVASDDSSDGDENSDDEELNKLDSEIATLQDEERRAERRKKKRALKEKRKIAQRIDLKMILPGDEGPKREEEGLFKIGDIKTKKDLAKVADQAPDMIASSSGEEDSDDDMPKKKVVKYGKEDAKSIDKSGLYYKESESEEESESDDDSGKEDLGLSDEAEDSDDQQDELDSADEDDMEGEQNPLLVSMEANDKTSRKERKANLWFDKDIFKGIDDDEDLEDADVENAIADIKQKGGSILTKKASKSQENAEESEKSKPQRVYNSDNSDDESDDEDGEKKSDSDSSDESDSDYDVNTSVKPNMAASGKSSDKQNGEGFEIVPKSEAAVGKKRKRIILSPEELALGQEMIKSKKTRRDIVDDGWNRFMFDDKDSDLPDWFVKEEEIHMRKHPEVDPKVVEFYKNRMKDVNVKTIKKVVEAKARKKRKLTKRLDKAKKRAAVIMENADLGTREKASEIKKLYKKAADSVKKQDVVYTVAKKHNAAKRAKRPAGVKGLYKQVDPRMKKDNSNKRQNATSKRLQKRRLKGKKTRPSTQKTK